jgi:hypothetical protein
MGRILVNLRVVVPPADGVNRTANKSVSIGPIETLLLFGVD